MLIQCGALPLTLAILYVMASFRLPADYLTLAVVQGLVAALLTWKLALAAWWRAIQLLFPLALLTTLALQLPPWLFGAGFLLLLGWYWSTFRTQVPYYPSGPAVWDALRQQLPAEGQGGRPLRVIDIGSGLGGLGLYLARVRPEAEITGIELAPLPWLVSWLRARLGRSQARFVRGDYERLDFSQFDVVFAYLSPAAMPGLWRKASAEMQTGSMLVSYEFVIEEMASQSIIRATEAEHPLYIWYF
ncbi:methyltransferase domain-containing protein [Duganella sp. sic0402]|uniref:methyltransferase domain-containing protein n=1 Tax=Duganella sp. sic0402 TaxID=2854786 RepID=UPI001C466943|nr:methyltransferase domain-containing protein [Duganella sp. sic0402]MBV7535322.1 methyltransferase domain-containing protein [Duganella sp. sic0402]